MQRICYLLLLLLLLAGCGPSLPSEAHVSAGFRADYPAAELVGVSIGEGPRESAYVHYHFRSANSQEVNKVVWTYARGESGDWEVTHRAKPLLPLD